MEKENIKRIHPEAIIYIKYIQELFKKKYSIDISFTQASKLLVVRCKENDLF